MSKTFNFGVWSRIGGVSVKADSYEEACEKLVEYGHYEEDVGIEFDPFDDGQNIEYKDE